MFFCSSAQPRRSSTLPSGSETLETPRHQEDAAPGDPNNRSRHRRPGDLSHLQPDNQTQRERRQKFKDHLSAQRHIPLSAGLDCHHGAMHVKSDAQDQPGAVGALSACLLTTERGVNPDSLEGSIQKLLSALYPPFEATAPTVLSQLFQIIDSRYQGDALRCLLDFLVPAKHILDSVQQAACAQYSDVVFHCEGWPLCLRDQVVVHLAPINPLILQPGDFYLQVVPFCDQSARIVVCSLLEEEGLRVEVVEETPIPETSYPCIFSCDWLEEINQGRHATPLSQCLLATEQGVVRLPWERVAVPEFVDVESASKQSPLTSQNSVSKSSAPHPSAFSVETRICPAKHGIAVSLRLVDTSTAASSRPNMPGETGPPSALHHSQPHHPHPDSHEPSHCVRTVRFAEKPCTPCMRRRQGGKVSRAQELRCRYRESYQAAIQNPVAFGREKDRGNMLAVVEEDGDFSQCDERWRPPEADRGDPWCYAQGTCCDPGMQNQSASPVSGAVLPQNRRESIQSDGRCSSLSTAVVDTSEKCELVIVQGQNVRRRESTDSCAEMVPRLHVVKCKNTTAFGLVSPKINRRKMVIKDGAQPGNPSIPSRNGHQTETQRESDPPAAAETHRKPHPGSARPRPDHLPLGSPDPRTHPLYLGLASHTGGRDRTGRAIVEVYGEHQGWRSAVTSQELFHMLLYFHSITRREIRESGMTLIFDARRTAPQPQLYKALMTLQEQTPQVINSLVLLVDKESSHRPESCPGVQTEVVTSMKALYKLVEVSQLTSYLDGTLSHSRCDWLELHQKLFPFVSDLHEASNLLLRAISKLEEPQRIDTVQTVQQCMMDQRTLMRDVLEDSRLVSLQREGGSILARLRKESDLKYPHCEDLSDAVDSVTSLYNHVEEQAHVLVQKSNMSLEHLEYLLRLREMEGHFMQIQEWFDAEGERHLLEAETVEDSRDAVEQTLNSFTAFLIEANDRQHHAMSLVSEAERLQGGGLSYPETEVFRTLVCTFKSGLEEFLSRAEACGRELQIMVSVSDFCEQATALARECKEYLDQKHGSGPTTTTNVLLPGDDTAILQTYQDRFLQFSPERFQEVKAQAGALRSSRGMLVWNVAWLKCQETRQQLQERMQDVDEVYHQQPHTSAWCERQYVDEVGADVQTVPPSGQNVALQSTPGPRHPQWEGIVSGAVDIGKRRPILGSGSTNATSVACCNVVAKPDDGNDARTNKGSKVTPDSPHRSTRKAEREARRREMASRARSERDAAALSQSHTVGCQWFPWGRGLGGRRSVSEDSCSTAAVTPTPAGPSTLPEPPVRPPSSCSHHGQPSCRILQEAQRFQISRHGSFCSDESCMGDEGAAGADGTSCCKHSSLPIRRYEGTFCLASPQESASNALRLQRVLEELVFTEREYVRSLGYILTHYHPLLERPDIPQDLRGKRGVIFGNLEKLYDFHSHYFLPELEACQREPAMVARCFLRHMESFGLYALYSKNKPQSDALILHRRHDIFKRKQQELGDMMDLSSYLLRPIQRISKYSLLLQDMLTLCVSEREREKAEIQAAADLVRFQMRHGNDLLTMDAIQDCDVNLKEQGQLIRQDEFTVFFRKKKCVRRIFLFESLVLFSKTKRTEIGNDVYVYKQSFKTCDIGMTHNSSVSGLCFEIWFRRRKSEDTYTLKASSMEVKKAWTTDLERILWEQATHSRELRMQERVFMGMGRKPFMDIQSSEAAICDRAVNCVPPGRIPVACCSHRGLEYPRPHSIGSGSTASTTLSQSSSSSGRGSLPPVGYPGNQSQGAESGHAVCSSPEAVADNELNNHHLHQHHLHRNCEPWKPGRHLLMDSTESSGECISLFSSSDHSCLSAIGGEVVDSSSSFLSQSSKPRPSLCRTPSLRRNGSPAFTRERPSIVPKPQGLANAQ
ncbi:pleckstrin homology domain-containing family G member 4B-like, partial [Centroberyx affinis]|uniref:pleckstrin homology domain-containing family G member 4B-like n=1 Tax=Centroberyx affinis TaxID=166261 RepID=UPI003A5C5B43